MSIFENIKMALISIFDNKLRSFLTMISIIIGIGAVIAITSIGRGVSNNMVDQFLDIMNGSISVSYTAPEDDFSDMDLVYGAYSFEEDTYTTKQIEQLKALPLVKDVIVNNSDYVSISYLEKEMANQQLSTLDANEQESFAEMYNIVNGEMFTENQFNQSLPIVLIHEDTATKLFGEGVNPVGKDLIANSKIFTIAGVYTQKTAPIGLSYGTGGPVVIPYNSWISYKGYEEIQAISVVPADVTLLKETGLAIEESLNSNKTLEGTYRVVNLDSFVEQIESQLSMMTMFITLIAAISLIVGGIGVMNIMYVSVVERTHEIGLRKALGASGTQVLWQFLIESITITSLGGLLGIALGLLGNLGGSLLIDYTFHTYWDVVFIGFGFAAAIGLLFGTLPAVKASKMQPIDALRSL